MENDGNLLFWEKTHHVEAGEVRNLDIPLGISMFWDVSGSVTFHCIFYGNHDLHKAS